MTPVDIQPKHRYRTPLGEIRRVRVIDQGVVIFTALRPPLDAADIPRIVNRILPLTRFASEAQTDLDVPRRQPGRIGNEQPGL